MLCPIAGICEEQLVAVPAIANIAVIADASKIRNRHQTTIGHYTGKHMESGAGRAKYGTWHFNFRSRTLYIKIPGYYKRYMMDSRKKMF